MTIINEQQFLEKRDLNYRRWTSHAIDTCLIVDRYVRHQRDEAYAKPCKYTALYQIEQVLAAERSPIYASWRSLATPEEKDALLKKAFSTRLAEVLHNLDIGLPVLQGKTQKQIDFADAIRSKELLHIAAGTRLLRASGLSGEAVSPAVKNLINIDPGTDGTRWLMHFERIWKGSCCPAEYWADRLRSLVMKPIKAEGETSLLGRLSLARCA